MDIFKLIILAFCAFFKPALSCVTTVDNYAWVYNEDSDMLIPGLASPEACLQRCIESGDDCQGYTWQHQDFIDICLLIRSLKSLEECDSCTSGTTVESVDGGCGGAADHIIDEVAASSVQECWKMCVGESQCTSFTWFNASSMFTNTCFMFSSCIDVQDCTHCVSGRLLCIEDYIQFTTSSTNYPTTTYPTQYPTTTYPTQYPTTTYPTQYPTTTYPTQYPTTTYSTTIRYPSTTRQSTVSGRPTFGSSTQRSSTQTGPTMSSTSRPTINSSESTSRYSTQTTSRYTPSSTTFTPTASRYTPSSTTYTPTASMYTPSSTTFTPTASRYTQSSTTYTPTASRYTPSSTTYTPTASRYTPSSTTYTPTASRYTPSSTTYTPTASKYTPTTSNSGSLPYQCNNYKVLDDMTRSVNSSYSNYCDEPSDRYTSPDWHGSGYYRVLPPAGNFIADNIDSAQRCGTDSVGYLMTMHPSAVGESVDAKVCITKDGNPWIGSCDRMIDASITNCNGYFVYYLTDVFLCSSRYCAADNLVYSK